MILEKQTMRNFGLLNEPKKVPRKDGLRGREYDAGQTFIV